MSTIFYFDVNWWQLVHESVVSWKVASSRRVGKSIFGESVVGSFIKHMINNIIEQSLAIKNLNFPYLIFPIT